MDRRVLIPRPSTEGLVDLALDFVRNGKEEMRTVDSRIVVFSKQLKVWEKIETTVDVGTGSGCIAITMACERPDLTIIATDLSPDALIVAEENARRHGVADQIAFRCGDGLAPVSDLREPFLLVSNPPYIPSGNHRMRDVQDYEPHVALFGGEDGMDVVRKLMREAQDHPLCVGWVMEFSEKMANNQSPRN